MKHVLFCRCGSGDWTSNMEGSFIQSVAHGKHSYCPTVTGIMDKAGAGPSAASDALYTHQHLYGKPPPPLGEIVNLVDGASSGGGGDEELAHKAGFIFVQHLRGFLGQYCPLAICFFIHALTNATDDHKYSPLPSADFDSFRSFGII